MTFDYTFPKSFQSKILLDLAATHRHSKITDAWIRVVDNTTIEGYQKLKLIQSFNYYGNLSGWYVMSAMGLYPPVNAAAADEFVLGSPLFKKITLKLPEYIYGGNTFTIECQNYAPENIYVEWVELDGKRLDNFKMPIDALRTGKKLVFKMSPKPVIK